MKILLVVDLQKEFVKDLKGKQVYVKGLDYIAQHRDEYSYVLAAVYKNEVNSNIQRFVDWSECRDIQSLEFIPDKIVYHSGYSISEYPNVTRVDQIDLFGLDTDACVLSAAFHVFDMGCGMRILSDLCWSSGGKKMHEAGLMCMKRQFGKAVV